MNERFGFGGTEEEPTIKDLITGIEYPSENYSLLVLINDLYNCAEQSKKQLEYIQNSISEHIKHQKTEIGKNALKEIIQDYNEWMLGHKGE